MKRRRGRLEGHVALGALAVLVSVGCSPRYVMRAAWEEAKFLWRREPIEALLRDGALDAERRKRLEVVLETRRFARDVVGLEVDGSYTTVSEVDGSAIVHLLSGARRDRLESYTWWFPIVGRVPYKGFFSKAEALAAADELEARGYDTYVRPAIAFSTLGWFDDPLPSTLLRRRPVTLANVVFHELFHATVFVRGEMEFNESAASFVGHRAAIELFCRHGREMTPECDEARAEWRDTLAVSRFVADAIAELETFYATSPSGEALEEGRRRMFDAIRERARTLDLGGHRYADLAELPRNNATLLHDRVYLRELEAFDALYDRHPSLAAAVDRLRAIADSAADPFAGLRH